jgi:hypothetical protein
MSLCSCLLAVLLLGSGTCNCTSWDCRSLAILMGSPGRFPACAGSTHCVSPLLPCEQARLERQPLWGNKGSCHLNSL